MACYHPLKAWPTNYRTAAGKPVYKITDYETDKWSVSDLLESDQYLIDEPIQIPCGKCVGCRLAYSRQWADRCMLEASLHEHNQWITLTYDDLSVPMSAYGDPETGEALPCMTLRKRDLQLWMKRLRKKFSDQKLRFYGCGEYGSNTMRPHYHVIVFGLELNDLKPYKYERGSWFYNSESVSDTWPYGFAVIAEVSWETCAYTARYVMKKAGGFLAEEYELLNIEPEFVNMSRKPGIARAVFDQDPDHVLDGKAYYLATAKGGRKIYPPKYFEKLYDQYIPGALDDFKERRLETVKTLQRLEAQRTDLDYLDYLAVKEAALTDRVKKLIREEL